MSEQRKGRGGQRKDETGEAEGLSRREALEATLKKAAYVAPVAVLLLSKPTTAVANGSTR